VIKNKKKILVIGGTGFIGHHLLKLTVKLGWISSSISRQRPKKIRKVNNVKYFKGDIFKFNSKNKKFNNYDYAVNLSNNYKILKTKDIETLIQFIKVNKIKKFIQIGSSSEYGNIKKLISENTKCKPISNYGKIKLALTKNLLASYKRENLPVIIIRLFQVYGPDDDQNKIIPYTIKNCKNNKRFNLTYGYQTRDFSHINDIVNSLVKLLKSKKNLSGQIFNIASGKSIKIKELVKLIRTTIGRGKPQFGVKVIKKNEIINSKVSIKKIIKSINWQPKISLAYGLNKLIRDEK